MSHKHLFWAQRLYQNNIEGSPRFMKKWLNIHFFKIYNFEKDERPRTLSNILHVEFCTSFKKSRRNYVLPYIGANAMFG